MDAITFYDPSDGKLLGWVEGDPETIRVNKLQGSYLEGKYAPQTHWSENGQAQLRPPNPTQWQSPNLINVPAGSTISINGATYTCLEGGQVGIEIDQPGTYTIQVESWPYLDKEFIIEN